jgi:hypothetical protein
MKHGGEHLKELTEDERQARMMWAAFAMQSLIANAGYTDPKENLCRLTAVAAFRMADAMLEASTQ